MRERGSENGVIQGRKWKRNRPRSVNGRVRKRERETEREKLRGHFFLIVGRKWKWMGREERDETQGQEVKTSCHVL